jgi:hypothetical protein
MYEQLTYDNSDQDNRDQDNRPECGGSKDVCPDLPQSGVISRHVRDATPAAQPGLCSLTDLPRYACGHCTGTGALAPVNRPGRPNTMTAWYLGRCEYCDGWLAGRFRARLVPGRLAACAGGERNGTGWTAISMQAS